MNQTIQLAAGKHYEREVCEARPAMPDLGHLRTFLAVIDTGGFAGASRVLGREHRVIARDIDELGKTLATSLFARTQTGALPTSSAMAAIPRIREVMADLAVWRSPSHPDVPLSHRYQHVPMSVLKGRRLEIFCRLLRGQRMSEVGNQLGLSQPTVSVAVAHLEDSVKVPLFARSARGLIPTAKAVALGELTQRAVNAAQRIGSDIAFSTGLLTGQIVIGSTQASRGSILPDAIGSLVSRYPQIRITTIERSFHDLCAELRSGNVDFILGPLRDSRAEIDLEMQELFIEGLEIVTGRDNMDTMLGNCSLHELTRHPWIIPQCGTRERALLVNSLCAMGTTLPEKTIETCDSNIIRGLLKRTNMLAVVVQSQMAVERVSGEIVTLPVTLDGTSHPTGIIRRVGSLPSPPAMALEATIREIVLSRSSRA